MHTKVFRIASLFLLAGLFFYCGKDKEEPQEESPFYDFFNEASIIIDTIEQSADAWEYGFVFTPLKSGKITQFGIKLPAEGDFTVSLWNLSGPTPVLVQSKAVNSSALHENASSNVPEITLEKNVKYGVTVRSDAFYRITKAGGGKFNFPKTIGSIRIESFNEAINNTALSTFPPDTTSTRVAPCVNVIFISE